VCVCVLLSLVQGLAKEMNALPSREAFTANGPPLDYSFKELRNCEEIKTEEPRSGAKRPDRTGVDATEESPDGAEVAGTGNAPGRNGALTLATNSASASGTQKKLILRKVTTSVKLNNNMLESAMGLPEALAFAMSSPQITLQMLDMSFNQLTTVDPSLTQFVNLKALYLHGNCIRTLSSTERLKKLPKLLILTLNGNPIESTKIYRPYVCGHMPNLRTLDHSHITEEEKKGAATWHQGHAFRQKEREARLKDQALIIQE